MPKGSFCTLIHFLICHQDKAWPFIVVPGSESKTFHIGMVEFITVFLSSSFFMIKAVVSESFITKRCKMLLSCVILSCENDSLHIPMLLFYLLHVIDDLR